VVGKSVQGTSGLWCSCTSFLFHGQERQHQKSSEGTFLKKAVEEIKSFLMFIGL
jgi:hypothetical protein